LEFNGATIVLGLLGDPVAQARSPGAANTALMYAGQLGAYVVVPMHVTADHLADFVNSLRHMRNFGGAIVTMPHKVSIVPLIDELTPEARLIGAVNVMRREPDGRLIGTALDGEGFVGGLVSSGHLVRGAKCMLAGAGGAASSVAFALGKHGAAVLYLTNRTRSKAEALAMRLRENFPQLAVHVHTPPRVPVDFAINGTSLGMKINDPLPFEESLIDRARVVAECVIAPERTKLLELARRKGKRIHTGLPMLAAQVKLMLDFMRAG
jgi:shikimate dehydrogenase